MEKRSMLARMSNAGLNGLGAALCWSMKLPMSVLGGQSAFKIDPHEVSIAGRMTEILPYAGNYCRFWRVPPIPA
jgi:hypothetical protein